MSVWNTKYKEIMKGLPHKDDVSFLCVSRNRAGNRRESIGVEDSLLGAEERGQGFLEVDMDVWKRMGVERGGGSGTGSKLFLLIYGYKKETSIQGTLTTYLIRASLYLQFHRMPSVRSFPHQTS